MYNTVFVVFALASVSLAEPKPGVFAAYTAPVIAPAVVTAQSSQYFTRNFNGFVTPVFATAPVVESVALEREPAIKAAPVIPETDDNVESIETVPVSRSNKLVDAPVFYKSDSTPYYKSAPLRTDSIKSAPVKSGKLVSAPIAYSAPYYKSGPLVTDAIVKSAPIVKSAQVVTAPVAYSGSYYTNAPFVTQPLIKTARLITEPFGKVAPVITAPIVKSAPLVAEPVVYSTPYYNPYIASPYISAHTPIYV